MKLILFFINSLQMGGKWCNLVVRSGVNSHKMVDIMKMITGIYNLAMDDKGRLLLPSRMRQALLSDELVVLPGLDGNHLMIMTPSYFEDRFSQAVLSSDLALFDKEKRSLIRRLISPAVYIQCDANGRIGIPLNFREKYSMQGKCSVTLVGTGYAIELWNTEVYEKYMDEDDTSLSDLADSLVSEE